MKNDYDQFDGYGDDYERYDEEGDADFADCHFSQSDPAEESEEENEEVPELSGVFNENDDDGDDEQAEEYVWQNMNSGDSNDLTGLARFYHTHGKVLRGEEARTYYAERIELVKHGTPEQHDKALEELSSQILCLIYRMVGKYAEYGRHKSGLIESLVQTALGEFIAHVTEYDPSRSDPSTFFDPYLKHAIYAYNTSACSDHRPGDETLIRKLKRVRAEFVGKTGREPKICDYMIQTGESQSRIKFGLACILRKGAKPIEEIPEFSQRISGNAYRNSDFASPENIAVEHSTIAVINGRMHAMFSDAECDIFTRGLVEKEDIKLIAEDYGVSVDKAQRTMEKVRKGLAYDPVCRAIRYGSEVKPEHIVIPTLDEVETTQDALMAADLI